MQIHDMRALIKSVYPSTKWERKVNKMMDGQVIAIYYALVKQGKIK